MINSTGSLSPVFQTVIGRVPALGGGVTDELRMNLVFHDSVLVLPTAG